MATRTRYQVGDRVQKMEWVSRWDEKRQFNVLVQIPVWEGDVVGVNPARGGNPTIYRVARKGSRQDYRLINSLLRKKRQ